MDHSKLWVVQNGRVHFTPVTLGFMGQNIAEITSGVKEGDEIILEELSNFKNGQRVRTVDDVGQN
jgi:hypothetical protein